MSTLFTEIYPDVWGYKDAGYEDGGVLSGTHPIQSGGNIYGYIGAIFVPEHGQSLSDKINVVSPYNVIGTNKIIVHLCLNDGHPYLGLTQITIKNANHSDIAITNITSLYANSSTATNILKSTSGATPAVLKQPAPLNARNTNNYVFIATISTYGSPKRQVLLGALRLFGALRVLDDDAPFYHSGRAHPLPADDGARPRPDAAAAVHRRRQCVGRG